MSWIEPQRIPLLVSGLAMLILAGLLASIDFQKRLNRAFAGVLALRGIAISLSSLSLGAGGTLALHSFLPYVNLAIAPLLLYFGSMFPRRRGLLGRSGAGWAVLVVIVLLWSTYFAWHDGYYRLEQGPSPTPILNAGGGWSYAEIGPLAVIGYGIFPLMAALGLLFARDYTQSSPGTQRTSYFLVAAGFLVNGAFDGSRQAVGLARLLADQDAPFQWFPWGWSLAVLPVLSLVPAIAGLAYVAVHQFRGAGERRRELHRERLLFGLTILAVATGAGQLLLPAGSEFFDHPATLILLGLWRLTLPLFVTYALLRYALFDIDLKVRAAVAWTFVAVVFGAVYFLVSETLEGLVSDRYGQLGGLSAAALLTVASGPLANAGRKVAHALMPGVRDLKTVAPTAGEEIYRQQFLMLQEDGILTPKERRSLDELRGRLSLALKRARAIEAQALRALTSSGGGPAAA